MIETSGFADHHLALLFQKRVEQYGERIALRFRERGGWRGISWRELGEQAQAVACGLVELGVAEREMVGIFSSNRAQWTIADLGIMRARATSVPIYPTSTAGQAGYILDDAGIRVLFVGGRAEYEKALSLAATRELRIVILDPAIDPAIEPATATDRERPIRFRDLLELGRRAGRDLEIERRLARARSDDLVTLIYTSGTTGPPKGVMLDHANLLSSFPAHDERLVGPIEPTENDVSLCFLPLSHVFERCWTYYALQHGMTNHYLEDPAAIVAALKEVRPTIMCAVPRFYEKVHATVMSRLETAPPLQRRLFRWALGVGERAGRCRKDGRRIPLRLSLEHAVADALVLRKIRDILGGRIRFMPCAGAPLSREIEEFFWAAGVFICVGYGLTESCATVSCHEPRRFEFGTVGRPLAGLQVRIGERDEIQVKGPTIMRGYYRKPEATAEVLADGWLRTGDAGRIDERGILTITDRIKDLMKTSGGKYVAPQAIEADLATDSFIEQVAVVGDQRSFVTALIVPAFQALEQWAHAQGIAFSSREELIRTGAVLDLFRGRVEAHNASLARFEQIKKFSLLPRELTVEAGEITPTLKIRRRTVAEKYRDLIEAMYAATATRPAS